MGGRVRPQGRARQRGEPGPTSTEGTAQFGDCVDDIDATWERVKGLVPQTVPEMVLEPTDMPWGNRSMMPRDPAGLVNLFTPITPEAKAMYGV